jgi:hypothetical protein
MSTDPRAQVEEPVRGALVGVMGRGIALVALMALLALWPVVARPDAAVRDGIAGVALGVLIGYSIWVRATARHAGRPSADERARAWERAREIDGDDAALSLLVAGWVPAGLVLAIGLLLWPHLTDANRALAAGWLVLGMPPFALAWLLATTTWLDACRDDLARAARESDTRFRRYWANPGR